MFKLDPHIKGLLGKQLDSGLEAAATAAAIELDYQLSANSSPRTGRHYPKLPRRSSANIPKAENLQEQSGATRRAVGWEAKGQGYIVGIIDHPHQDDQQLSDNEFGSADGRRAGRYTLTRTMERPRTHELMARAIGDSLA